MSFVIPAPPPASVEVTGTDDRFPVRRIYCIGRNYLATSFIPVRPMESARSRLVTLSLPVSTASANSR